MQRVQSEENCTKQNCDLVLRPDSAKHQEDQKQDADVQKKVDQMMKP